MSKYTCLCCGYKTLYEEPPGTFDICEVCFWEDDNLMGENPDYWGGANGVCLRQAQRNFIRFGVSEKKYLDRVVSKEGFEKDPLWKPVWEGEASLNEQKLAQIEIDGNVIDSKFKESIHINDFLDAFTEFVEKEGWGFGGEIKQKSTPIDKRLGIDECKNAE